MLPVLLRNQLRLRPLAADQDHRQQVEPRWLRRQGRDHGEGQPAMRSARRQQLREFERSACAFWLGRGDQSRWNVVRCRAGKSTNWDRSRRSGASRPGRRGVIARDPEEILRDPAGCRQALTCEFSENGAHPGGVRTSGGRKREELSNAPSVYGIFISSRNLPSSYHIQRHWLVST